jgi:mRNA interferase RelE/StbE
MYRVEFLPEAAEDVARLDRAVAQRVFRKLRWLAENLDSLRPEPLSGSLAGLMKLRVGDYRVVYQIDHERNVLTIFLVGHRREIYQRLP